MCDVEEPPAKISKVETGSQNAVAEESQEEWLSEDMLTDDDNLERGPDKTDSNLDTSQEELDETFLDETMLSAEHSMDSQNMSQTSQADASQEQETSLQTSQENIESKETAKESIEQTLNDFENQNQETTDKQADSKTAGKSDDNDTDDLLRLLEDNGEKSKKKVLVKTKEKKGLSRGLKEKSLRDDGSGSSDDDEYIFNGTATQKLRMAKSALARKPAAKAEPEDFDEGDDETDCSSDEAVTTMQNIFAMKDPKNAAKAEVKAKAPSNDAKSIMKPSVKKVLKIGDTVIASSKKVIPKNLPTKNQPSKSVLKTISRNVNNGPLRVVNRNLSRPISKERTENKPPSPTAEHDEIINDQEFMEEDDFDLDEDFASDSDLESAQQIMRPEEMDEQAPSDADSESGSDALDDLYDDVPSPESEDRDDWFSLDIRAERACDYLPLLGDKARSLLSSEKRRVSERLARLRALAARSGARARLRARRLRRAALALAELDDMLKAT